MLPAGTGGGVVARASGALLQEAALQVAAELLPQPLDDCFDLVEGALPGGAFTQFAEQLLAQWAQGGIDHSFQRRIGGHDSSSSGTLRHQTVTVCRFAPRCRTYCQHPQSHPGSRIAQEARQMLAKYPS